MSQPDFTLPYSLAQFHYLILPRTKPRPNSTLTFSAMCKASARFHSTLLFHVQYLGSVPLYLTLPCTIPRLGSTPPYSSMYNTSAQFHSMSPTCTKPQPDSTVPDPLYPLPHSMSTGFNWTPFFLLKLFSLDTV